MKMIQTTTRKPIKWQIQLYWWCLELISHDGVQECSKTRTSSFVAVSVRWIFSACFQRSVHVEAIQLSDKKTSLNQTDCSMKINMKLTQNTAFWVDFALIFVTYIMFHEVPRFRCDFYDAIMTFLWTCWIQNWKISK